LLGFCLRGRRVLAAREPALLSLLGFPAHAARMTKVEDDKLFDSHVRVALLDPTKNGRERDTRIGAQMARGGHRDADNLCPGGPLCALPPSLSGAKLCLQSWTNPPCAESSPRSFATK
jgi:hypothetical protein